MKILQINTVCGIKSTGRICTDLADVITQNGDTVKIAYGREAVPEQHTKYAHRITTNFGVKLDALRSRLFDNAGFNSKASTRRLIQWIKDYNPDIIHLHNLHGYYINIKILFEYLRSAGKPVVWTLHDCWAFTGHCCYFDFANCNKWESEQCQSCQRKNAYPASIGLCRSQSNFTKKKKLFTLPESITLVTPSQWLADRVNRSFLSKYPKKVIHNGIDLEIFSPRESNFKEMYDLTGKKTILAVAAIWDKRKGFHDVLKLADLLDDDYRIVMVGVSQEQKQLLPKNVVGICRTDSAIELAEIYTAADVFINTTYEDNFPTVNLEAQACGTPVITYRTGGSIESVLPENIVETGDVAALRTAIEHLMKQPVDTVRTNALENSKKYNKAIKYGEYMNLYRSLI